MNRVHAQSGYVLLLVLWAMVVLSVIASRSLDLLTEAQELAVEESSHADVIQSEHNTLSHILYLLARQKGQIRGLPTGMGIINSDGTVYAGSDDILFNIFDQHSLLNVNTLDNRSVEYLLTLLGERLNSRQLLAQLGDYRDQDEWPEAGGAERMQYRARGVAGPANHIFRTPGELFLLPVFGEKYAGQIPPFVLQQLTSLGTGRVNINGAPLELIEMLAPLYGINLSPISSRREASNPFNGLPEFKRALGLPTSWPIDYNQVSFGLSRYVRINIWHKHSASLTEYNVINTPNKQEPWRIVYVRKHPIPEQWSKSTPNRRFRQTFQTPNLGVEG